jgi:putative SOS response-associated peptidase YedK
MCGRFDLTQNPAVIALQFALGMVPAWTPRYNIAPTQRGLIVRQDPTAGRVAASYRWGLVPGWAKDPSIGNRLINARGDTVAEKPAFRSAFKRWRCLVPASGFYEWKVVPGARSKQPYRIVPANDPLFAFAGLTERWEGPEGPLQTFCIVTTDANDLMRPIHDRMPAIIAPGDYERWLDPANTDTAELKQMIRPYPADQMRAYAVSTRVNNVRNEDPSLIEPMPEPRTNEA